MIVSPDAAAQDLDSGFPHTCSCCLKAIKELARLMTIQVTGTSRGIWSHFPPQWVKDNDNGDHSGGDDNPAANREEKAW